MKVLVDETILELPPIDELTGIKQLISGHLCYDANRTDLSGSNEKEITNILNKARKKELNIRRFNKLLEILGQSTLNKCFFQFFFNKSKISLKDLIKGTTLFKMYSMLCFGNFRRAYKNLSESNKEQIKEILGSYSTESTELKKKFRKRKKIPESRNIKDIDKEYGWLIGYITKKVFKEESKILSKLISDMKSNRKGKYSFGECSDQFEKIDKNLDEVEKIALENTKKYLKINKMDVYIATSMRHNWEYEETSEFIQDVFNQPKIRKLKLQKFDPTQSSEKNRIDKGLIEGLMLKKACCTIYMVQETDTFGKDSELASTLAQGKPVVAYVQIIKIKSYAKKIKRYPLEFFKRRLLILKTENIFEEGSFLKSIESNTNISNYEKLLNEFEERLKKYRKDQPLTLCYKKDKEFKEKYKKFDKICNIIAIADYYYFEKRAEILRKYHPLSIQIDLKSGVANGVLVVRNSKDCADLLYNILTNSMEFNIKEEEGITILEENISRCPFRVVTDNKLLADAFWNYYI